MTVKALAEYVGELAPGQYGWLPLNPDGTPSGPCTHLPPANSLAAYVRVSREGDLVSSAGAPLIPPIASNVDTRVTVYEEDVPVVVPTIVSLFPANAIVGGPDVTLIVTGTGFTPESVINFNGGAEITTYISPNDLNTIVKPSLATIPLIVPVYVVNPSGASNTMNFELVAAANTQSVKEKGKDYSTKK